MAWKRGPFLEEKLDELLDVAADRDLDHKVIIRALAHTGMRADELEITSIAVDRFCTRDWDFDAFQIGRHRALGVRNTIATGNGTSPRAG